MFGTKEIVLRVAVILKFFGNTLALLADLSDFGAVLLDPPGRGSLWRHNIRGTPINFLDHHLNCGGVKVNFQYSDQY
jgi:hypothetical protein